MKKILSFVFLACVFAAVDASAATVRLVYGKDWSKAGRDVAKTLQSQAWKSLAKSQYKVELVDEEEHQRSKQNLGSNRLPAIFVLDDQSRCYCVIENVPNRATADWLYRQVSRATELRHEIEKKFSPNSIDGCGELMFAMERFVGGPKRVISEGFYKDVYEKLKTLDPSDKEGWLRHFTMPFVDHEGKKRVCNNSDGLEIVEEATYYRKEGKLALGEKFIDEQMKLPRGHLTKEQTQGLLMAKFALYAPDDMNKRWESPKRAEMVKILKRVAEYDEDTFWGTCALGWLGSPAIGEPLLSVYDVEEKRGGCLVFIWGGWRKGDIPTGKFETTIKYGVKPKFAKPGEYAVTFERLEGAAISIDSLSLYKGKEEVMKVTRKTPNEPFVVKLERADAGRLTHMVIRGTSGGESAGRIRISRAVLKPRKVAK